MKTGHLTIVSGPSGSGKSTLIKKFIAEHSRYQFPTSVTTRQPREGEVNGDHYAFVDSVEFKKMRDAGEFLEWANVYGLKYGTLKSTILNGIENGKLFIKDIDVQGSINLMKFLPKAWLTTIFIAPPDLVTLEQRLRARKSDVEVAIKRRLEEADSEMSQQYLFDHVIINQSIDESYKLFCKFALAK